MSLIVDNPDIDSSNALELYPSLDEKLDKLHENGDDPFIKVCSIIIYSMEKVFALSKYAEIDPSKYFTKGRIPTEDECQEFLASLNNKFLDSNLLIPLKDEILSIQLGAEKVNESPNKKEIEEVFHHLYTEMTKGNSLTKIDIRVSFIAQLAIPFLANSFITQIALPFFVNEINESLEVALHFNTNRLEQIVSTNNYKEVKSFSVDATDRFIYGVILMALYQGESLFFGDSLLNAALPALLATPEVMKNILASNLFKNCKEYLLDHISEIATKKFQDKVLGEIEKREKQALKEELGINKVEKFAKNPQKETEKLLQKTKEFFEENFNVANETADAIKETSLLFFEKMSENFSKNGHSNPIATIKTQGLLTTEYFSKATDQLEDGINGVKAIYKRPLQQNNKNYLSPMHSIIGVYSPKWDLCFSILPKWLTPLLLSHSRSTNNELFMRGLFAGGLLISGQVKEMPLWSIALVSTMINRAAKKMEQDNSIMEGIEQNVDAAGKLCRKKLLKGRKQIFSFLIDQCGVSRQVATEVMQFLKELSYASPMLLLSLLSDNNYLMQWLFFYNPLKNVISALATKIQLTTEEELDGQSSLLSLTHNNLVYNCLCFSLLMIAPSNRAANIFAVISQMPYFKDTATAWITETKFSPIRFAATYIEPRLLSLHGVSNAFIKAENIIRKHKTFNSIISGIEKGKEFILFNPLSGGNLPTKLLSIVSTIAKFEGLKRLPQIITFLPENKKEKMEALFERTKLTLSNVPERLCYSLFASIVYHSIPSIPAITIPVPQTIPFAWIFEAGINRAISAAQEGTKTAAASIIASHPTKEEDPNFRKSYIATIGILSIVFQGLAYSVKSSYTNLIAQRTGLIEETVSEINQGSSAIMNSSFDGFIEIMVIHFLVMMVAEICNYGHI